MQWACPACSAKVEVAEMSAPQQKPKRDRKDGKKRQRASNAVGAGSASLRVGAGANSFTIPKRKGKRSKGLKEEGGPSSPRVKGEEREEAVSLDEVAPSPNSANRMVTAPQKANILPRVGLGLTDAKDEMSAMRHPDSSGGRNGDRSPSKAMMSLAVAAASVAANEAAMAAAAAAVAATPAPAAPPKALGLKKLLHRRVQHDEANSNPAFSPKKLLKHRLLAAQQPPPPQPTSAPPASSPGAGGGGYSAAGGGYMDDAGNYRYHHPGQVDGTGAPPPPLAGDGGRFGGGHPGGHPDFRGGYMMDPSQGVGGVYGGGRTNFGEYDGERERVAAEGELNGRIVGDGREYNGQHAVGAIKEEIDDRGGHSNNFTGREPGVGPAGGTFRDGGVDQGRSSHNGDQRREAEFGGASGYSNSGTGAPATANGMHAGGVSGGGWRGGSEERRGRFAEDAAAANDKWQGGRGAERIDAPRQHGYDPSSYGPQSKRAQEVNGWNIQPGTTEVEFSGPPIFCIPPPSF